MNACVSATTDIRRHLESACRSVEVRDIRLYHDPSGWGQAEATIVLGDGSTIAGGFDYDLAGGLTVEAWDRGIGVYPDEMQPSEALVDVCDGWYDAGRRAMWTYHDELIRPAVPGLPLLAALRAAGLL
jgi:hypothetical protein